MKKPRHQDSGAGTVGLARVNVDLAHSFRGDLELTLSWRVQRKALPRSKPWARKASKVWVRAARSGRPGANSASWFS